MRLRAWPAGHRPGKSATPPKDRHPKKDSQSSVFAAVATGPGPAQERKGGGYDGSNFFKTFKTFTNHGYPHESPKVAESEGF